MESEYFKLKNSFNADSLDLKIYNIIFSSRTKRFICYFYRSNNAHFAFMEKIVDLALAEYFKRIAVKDTFQKQLSVIDMDNSYQLPGDSKNYPIRLKAYSLIMVLSGEIMME